MGTKGSRAIALGIIVLSLLVLGAAGTARSQPQPETYVRSGTINQERSGGRFVRTGTQRYYVDRSGRRHLIIREVTEPTAPLGMLYYIENDEKPYYVGEGERLYSRDQSGRVYYIDEANQGGTIGSGVIIIDDISPRSVPPMMQRESCASQYDKCMAGCQGVSRSERYTRPMCLNNCETIRNGCRGQ
ncbi:MAG: hypothetical protein AB9872_02280 [Solidesulfovibrio sp.]